MRRYVYGLSGPIVWYEGSGTTDRRWLVRDQLGSIEAVTNASGAVTTVNSFDEYGQPSATNTGRFQFAGQPWLAELSLYQMGARAYATNIGRFMQTDPILTGGGINIYAYVENDPLNAVDPTGLDSLYPQDVEITLTGWKNPDFGVGLSGGGLANSGTTADSTKGRCIPMRGGGCSYADEPIVVTARRLAQAGGPLSSSAVPQMCLASTATDTAARALYLSTYLRTHLTVGTIMGIVAAEVLGGGPEDPAADVASGLIIRSGATAYQAYSSIGNGATAYLWTRGLGSYAGDVSGRAFQDAMLLRAPRPPLPSHEGVLQTC